jgi:hypothetical protein
MRQILSLVTGVALTLSLAAAAAARGGPATHSVARDYSTYKPAQPGGAGTLTGGPVGDAAKAAADTFFLFGGPATRQGKFETAPPAVPSRQGWIGRDLTELPPHWHVSTFNAPQLPAAKPSWWQGAYTVPPTNHATWAGVPAGTPGFATAPGYGNNWNDWLDYRFFVPSAADSSAMQLAFLYNYDTEPGYDFFQTLWDSAGTMLTLLSVSASNRDTSGVFSAPAEFNRTIRYRPGTYAGPAHNQIHLRIRLGSDGAASDEDGLWPTDGGAQVDQIQVRRNGTVISQATFEGGSDGGWTPVPADFVGDFSKLFTRFQDTDPCLDNLSPQMGFIDDGTPPNNDALGRSTGGNVGTAGYGIPGGWVVNYTGGLTLGGTALNNEVWSPPFAYDLPGPADDGAVGGAFLHYLVWSDLPLLNGIFSIWHIRSYPDPNSGTWGPWVDRNFVYYGSPGAYINNSPLNTTNRLEVSDLLVNAPDSVQIAMGVVDLADIFNFPGNDATPAPLYDNIAFAKYNAVGPGFATRELDIFNDSFPQSGTPITDGTHGGFQASDLAIRLDMAQDIRPIGAANVPGDSIIVDIVARKPGAVVDESSIKMLWALDANPAFNAARAAALADLAAQPGSGVTQVGPNRWRGFVAGRPSNTAGGARVPNRWFFDLPDGPTTLAPYETPEHGLFFPGDVLRYCFSAATLNPAESAVLPADTSGFARGADYNRTYVVRGLPSAKLTVATGETTITQPKILLWNDFGRRGGENEYLFAFGQNGLREGIEYDSYTGQGPDSGVSNGLGSAGVHGANAQQLEGYECLIYVCEDLERFLISDGSGTGSNDKSDDVGVLTAWNAQPHNRYAAYFGDEIASGLGGNGLVYLANVMGVLRVANDARPSIGGQTAPQVTPTGAVPCFSTRYVAFGGCPGINSFDNIGPGAVGAVKAHAFSPGPFAPSASVYYARRDTIAAQAYDRVHVTFPYGFVYVYDVIGGPATGGGRSARANLLRDLLQCFGHPAGGGNVVAADRVATRRLVVGQNRPNPFNPVTSIEFMAPARGHVSVRVYNVRGERVATLLDANVDRGAHAVLWNGTDATGAPVGSGIYLYQVTGFGQEEVRKMALVK